MKLLSTDFLKILKQNFKKILPVEAESFHEDGRMDRQTDMTKLIVAIGNFANVSKNSRMCLANKAASSPPTFSLNKGPHAANQTLRCAA